MTLAEAVAAAAARSRSLLCLGLDPDFDRLRTPREVERWCLEVLEGALPASCAVKPNAAFFLQHGSAGLAVLERLRAEIPEDRLLILDAKLGDVGHTAEAYARYAFDAVGADAVTVNPLMGVDAVAPFLRRPGRGAFVLTRTTNPGAADVLERPLLEGGPVYARITELALSWDPGGAVGLVVGATAPDAVAAVRERAPAAPLLVPGVGAQGGSLERTVAAGLDRSGAGLLVSVSRAVAGAPEGPGPAAAALRDRIEAARAAVAETGRT